MCDVLPLTMKNDAVPNVERPKPDRVSFHRGFYFGSLAVVAVIFCALAGVLNLVSIVCSLLFVYAIGVLAPLLERKKNPVGPISVGDVTHSGPVTTVSAEILRYSLSFLLPPAIALALFAGFVFWVMSNASFM